jgi:hypothetical protein
VLYTRDITKRGNCSRIKQEKKKKKKKKKKSHF